MSKAPAPPPPSTGKGPSHREIYSFDAPWPVYGLHWSQRPNSFRLALGSFVESSSNKLQIIQLFNKNGDFVKTAETEVTYPVTKLMWSPYTGLGPDLLATSGDFLRIWELVTPDEAMDVELERPEGGFVGAPAFEERQLIPRGSLVNMRRSKKDYSAPLTSFDWNDTDPSLCVTSSVDTTCTVWDVQAQQAKTQLIAHDKEVFDVAFSKGVHVFASVGADGSVRMFDLRSLDHSTIIYETPSGTSPSGGVGRPSSLMRLAWNKLDTNYLATFQQDSNAVLILDVRVPAVPVTELHGHAANVSSIAWAPHSSKHICTTSDDCNALVWDITHMPKHKRIRDPVLAYQAPAEINNLSWSTVLTDFVAISHGRQVQALKI